MSFYLSFCGATVGLAINDCPLAHPGSKPRTTVSSPPILILEWPPSTKSLMLVLESVLPMASRFPRTASSTVKILAHQGRPREFHLCLLPARTSLSHHVPVRAARKRLLLSCRGPAAPLRLLRASDQWDLGPRRPATASSLDKSALATLLLLPQNPSHRHKMTYTPV